ncbi:MAG: hypothetical protein E7559_00245 [Ruminococcaceae bacterium]|nr:hypothetical protein [Oscillospiraceae bacterium]
MKKICCVILSVLLVCSLFCLSGCKEKVSVDAAAFTSAMEELGYTVKSESYQFQGATKEIKVYLAYDNDGNDLIEFYVLDSAETAVALFNDNKAFFESSVSGASSKSSVSAANYNTFRLTADGEFKVLSRIDNTMVFVSVPTEYKDAVNTALDKIGY